MARKRDWYGLLFWVPFAFILAFVFTKGEWFDVMTRDNKALFWTSLVSALASIGLFVVAVAAAVVAWYQFREFQRGQKIQATNEVLKEWSEEKYQRIIGFVDFGRSPTWCRRSARVRYLYISSPSHLPPRKAKARLRAWRERNDLVHNAIQDLSAMASRTWNLLEQGIVDEAVLFGQLDYDIVASYFELEDILAMRQHNDDLLYSEFTRLAQRAQAHYGERPERETCAELVEPRFRVLPFTENEFAAYMDVVRTREHKARLEGLFK